MSVAVCWNVSVSTLSILAQMSPTKMTTTTTTQMSMVAKAVSMRLVRMMPTQTARTMMNECGWIYTGI